MERPSDQRSPSPFARRLAALADASPPRSDGAELPVAARIRANVLEIVRKMHQLHHDAVRHGRGNPELLGLDESLEPEARIAAAWERFVGKLRDEWAERLAADERFGRETEAAKGRVQLAALAEAQEAWRSHRSGEEAADDEGR